MSAPHVPTPELMEMIRTIGPAETSRRTGLSLRAVYFRRERYEQRTGHIVKSAIESGIQVRKDATEFPGRICLNIVNGDVLIGSDCHYWPGPPSLMHRAFVHFVKEMKPKIIILNGDVIDACTISRHPPIGWEKQPEVQEEIEAAQERLLEIEKASHRARKIWTLGNHDGRFETRLATVAPEFAKVHGVHLRDHFPLWEPCWSCFINDDVVVKHRFKGGIHATHNNTLWSGRTMITGHLHSAKVTPLTDYNGTRWGVDGGCIADPMHRAFLDYTEDNPRNWRDSFVHLRFDGGKLLPPTLAYRWTDNSVVFNGEIIKP